MRRIDTKNFGLKNLLGEEAIEDTGLYIGAVSDNKTKKYGVIDELDREVIPFGNIPKILGIRVISRTTVIIDYIVAYGTVAGRVLGSYLCKFKDGEFKVYNSNAAVMLVNENKMYGANFLGTDSIYYGLEYPVQTFEYDYKKGIVENKETLDQYSFLNGGLQKYLLTQYLPYAKVNDQIERLRSRTTIEELQSKLDLYAGSNVAMGLLFKKHQD